MPYPYQPYTVNQSLDSVDLSFKVPPGSRSRDIDVKWTAKGVTACVKHEPPTIQGEFYGPIKSANSIWQLEGNTVTLHVEKKEDDFWPYIIRLGPQIDPCSKFHIANAMSQGLDGLKKDPAAALELIQEAANSGMEEAQMNMALIYVGALKGFNITPSDSQAFTYFSYAANQHGNPMALFHVAKAFHTGKGVEKSPSMAEKFYQKAAAQRNDMAIFNLGVLYRSGPATRDFQIDPKKALQCFVTAAEMGNPDANYALGTAYFGGDVDMVGGVDLYKAKTYYEKAAKLSEGELEIPSQFLEALEAQKEEEQEAAQQEKKKRQEKFNETTGLAQEAREKGSFGFMAGAVVVGLIAVFGFHWLATRN